METSQQVIDRLNREQWQPIRDEHQSVHRGLGMELSDEDHAVVHDSSRPMHERATRLMQHVARGHAREDYGWGGDTGGSGLGVHWTTDANVAHHFAKVEASTKQKFDEDADPRHGHNADGFPRQRPETRVVLHAHFPEHEHIAHEVDDQDGAFGWDERNPVQHSMNGGGVDFEREVPIKRGNPVKVHAISWGLASHRHDDPAPHDNETTRYDFPETQHHQARKEPHQRIFGPTYGLDVRLFDGDHLKPAVRTWVLDTIGAFWRPLYGTSWRRWARVYFAGSEASAWTSEALVGNGDFDTLVGIKPDLVRKFVPGFADLDDDAIVARLNADLTTLLWPRLLGIEIPTGDGTKAGPFDATVFVNLKAWDIREIKPYAAYNVTADSWAVRPPVLTDWSIESFPQGHALVQQCHAVASYVRSVLHMPEPYRSQQADALWRHLHSDRGRSFTDQGEGWYDSGNVIEKYLDQLGLWEPLAKLHFEAVEDPSKLSAPKDWSNDPRAIR